MNLNNIQPASGATHNSKRIGRGQGSGKGGTATKGHKGQKARAGYSQKIGFEGGQMPLQRRLPKFGFNNISRKEYRGINLDTIQALVDAKNLSEVTKEVLVENGLSSKNDLVKILGRGELKSAVSISAHKFTKSAEELIKSQTANFTVPLKEVRDGKLTGKTVNRKIDGCATWTPGDKMVFDKLSGFTDIVSTREFNNQMPTTLIVVKEFADKNPEIITNILKATYTATNQMKQYDES